MFFDRESSGDKRCKLLDELNDAEAEIEDALAEIEATADLIATGGFLSRHPQ
ncbi:hypothetical protein [Rhizobium sp. WL3]|uniref:hypothetical protein n=1 Tax=Rhizobium sp. WL3 TaxID=2603277 RepID=UPI00164F5837|nr:hypothetical protein [Rhizobium sp. WL3]